MKIDVSKMRHFWWEIDGMPIWAKIFAVACTLVGGFVTSFLVVTALMNTDDGDHLDNDMADIIDNVGISEEK